jgi:POT family proton-dependent oligopeptide transporter
MPIFLKNYGPSVAFGIPGVLMFIATLIFWYARRDYVNLLRRRLTQTRF